MFGSLLSCIKISQPAWVSKTHRPCVFCFVSGAYKKLARFFFFKFLFSFFVLSFKPSPLKPACAENKSVLSCVTSRGAKRINSSSVVLCRAVTFPRQLRTTHGQVVRARDEARRCAALLAAAAAAIAAIASSLSGNGLAELGGAAAQDFVVLVELLGDAEVGDLEDAVHAHLVRVRVRVRSALGLGLGLA